MSKLSCIVLHLGNLQALAWHSLFCVAVSRTYSYSTVGSMLGRPRGIPLQRLSAHLLRAMPSWGLGSLSPSVNICYPIALRDAVIYENALAFLAHRTPGPTTAAGFASSRGVSGYRRWPVC